MDDAIRNAKRLEKYHDGQGNQPKSIARNPSTEAYKLIEILKKAM